MNTRIPRSSGPSRRGAIAVMAALIMILALGMIALAFDAGYMFLTRTQLQAAADSSAMAAAANIGPSMDAAITAAKRYGAYHHAGGRVVSINDADVEFGTWDVGSRTFSVTADGVGNAVRVTTRCDGSTGGEAPLFFGHIFSKSSFAVSASAVAVANPRDIAFVVDVSGSMNDDSDPNHTDSINSSFASQGYPAIGTEVIQKVFDDFGYGAFPGSSQCIGQPLGIGSGGGDPLTQLSSTTGPLAGLSIPEQYRIGPNDDWNVCRYKAYAWAMDVQIPQVMPAAKPTPNSTTNYNYWQTYLTSNYSHIGYRTYVNFMMYYGRELKPDGANYTPLSKFSPNCPWHSEDTAGGTFSFPPREMPTHAARRAIIAAIQLIKERNQNITTVNQRDWVSVVSFDSLNSGGPVVQVPLTSNYDAAMQGCTGLQACSDSGASTATETGLITASNHLKPTTQGGCGRIASNKIVVLLTDGKPNLHSSSASQISNYEQSHPSKYFYGNQTAQDAALMQTSIMQGNHWYLYPVGIGLQCDYGCMDRMACIGATADKNGQSLRGSGNPADYEAVLTQIFQRIISNPKLRLVQ